MKPLPHSTPSERRAASSNAREWVIAILGSVLAIGASPASASFLSGEALDEAADILAWAVLVIAPTVGIVVFLIIHVLPEKIAERRHHPQAQAIQTLCLLSLVFGGLLWPFAWLWAFTRPVGYRAAYGTDKHEHYFVDRGEQALAGKLPPQEVAHLRTELEAMRGYGPLPLELERIRVELNEAAAKESAVEVKSRPAAVESPRSAERTEGA